MTCSFTGGATNWSTDAIRNLYRLLGIEEEIRMKYREEEEKGIEREMTNRDLVRDFVSLSPQRSPGQRHPNL